VAEAAGVDRAGDDLILVGRIARVHGLRGEVVITPETDFLDERFAPGAELLRRKADKTAPETTETLRVESMRVHKGRPIVGFEGIDTIEAAEQLGRIELWIRAADRAALPDGEFYHDALIGCRVETTAGQEVGTVSRVEGPRGMSLLVVKGEGAREVLVPLAEAICPVIDPDARRIVIDPPEGLLDLNG
jgi:16S rRNA processing protein RimM